LAATASQTCVATSPAFPVNSPLTLAVSGWSTVPTQSTVQIRETVVLDPAMQVLLAHPVTVSFAVSSGTTCAPDCKNPWTDASWRPMTTPTATAKMENVGGWNGYIVGLILGGVFGGIGCVLLLWLMLYCVRVSGFGRGRPRSAPSSS
jgi:hypothetical protein